MADLDINPFGGAEQGREHNRTEENIPLVIPGEGGVPTWEPERRREHEQETSFRGESQRTKLMKDYVKDLYKKPSESKGETQNHFTTIISNSKVGNYTT